MSGHGENASKSVTSVTGACEGLFTAYLSCAKRYAESGGMLRDECRREARAYRECMMRENERLATERDSDDHEQQNLSS
jgi:hypothetical protein